MTQTIGQKLKRAREHQHLTIDKASEATRIRAPYLQALETDDISALPSPVQARGFMRNYAEYLGLNLEQLLDELRAEQKPLDEIIGPADLSDQPATPLTNPEPDSTSQTESPPKRRGRKKIEPEPVVEPQSEIIAEPVVEIPVEIQPEESPKPNVSENLWQTWLNRLNPNLESDSLLSNLESDSLLSESQNLESTQIFKEIGVELRIRRELLSLHLDEVERNTHVKAHYLEALEKGAMNDLPSTVQTRGMLSNYATFLDLDVDAILLRYADALQARYREKNPQKPPRKTGQPIINNIPSIRNFIAGDMIFGVGMAVLLIGFSVWGINRVMMIQSQRDVQSTAPSISDVLLASPDPSLITPTATLSPIEAIVEATVTILIPTQNLNVDVQVNLIAVERTFMRVVVDGEEVFNGRVVPGTAYPFEAEDQIDVLVGNGAAIRIVYNGRDLGLLGGLGQVINNIYLADEIITPTAQPTLTATNTVPATSTVPPTLTPVPSNTSVP